MCSLTKGQLQVSQPCRQQQILPSHGWRKNQGRNISRHWLGLDAPAVRMHGYPRPRPGSSLSSMDLRHSIRTGSNTSPLWFCCLHEFDFFKLVPSLLEPKGSPAILLLFLRSEAWSTGSWMCFVRSSLANTISEQKASKAILRPSNLRKSPVAKARGPEGKRERHAFRAGPMLTKWGVTLSFSKCNYVPCYCCETPTGQWLCLAGLLLQQAVVKKQPLVRRWTDR